MKKKGRSYGLIAISVLSFLLLSGVIGAFTPSATSPSKNNAEKYLGASGSSIKPMVFYLHNDTRSHLIFNYSTTYILDTNLGHRVQNNGDIQRVRLNFYLFPQLAGNLTVNGNVTVGIYINTIGVSANANLYAEIYDVKYKSGSTTNEILVGSGGPVSYTITTGIDYYDVTIPNINYTFHKSDSIRIYIEIQGGASSYFKAWYGNETYDSRVVMDCANYMKIESVKTKNYRGNYTTFFDPDANNKTLTVESDVSDPFGGYDIKYVNVSIVGPSGNIIINNRSMNLVSGTPISFMSIYKFSWNYSSYPKGTYTVHVWALDNNGYYYYWHFEQYNYGPYEDYATSYFVIGYKYKVNVWVYDAIGNAVNYATVKLVESHGSVVSSNITNQNGYTMLLTYNGTYDLVVLWNDNRVTYSGTQMVVNGNNVTGSSLTVNGDTRVKVYADLGNLNIHVMDSHKVSLESAMVFIVYPNGTHTPSKLTNSTGFLSLGYSPGGDYYLSIYWKDVKIYSGYVEVHFPKNSENETIDIPTNVYYLTFRIVDNDNTGMPYLQVIIYDLQTQVVEEVGITNITGYTILRLPAGYKDIKVYFKDQVVYERKDFALTSDSTLMAHAWIYNVNLRILDSHSAPVGNANIYIYKEGKLIDNGTTDSNGAYLATLIRGNYTIKVFWLGNMVNKTTIEVTKNSSFNISASIFYLDITLRGNDGKPVDGSVIISEGGKAVYTLEGSHFNIRLPTAQYMINATINKEMYLTGVEEKISKNVSLSSDQKITMRFNNYPIGFFSSNLFYIILGYIILAAIVAAILLLQRKKRYVPPYETTTEKKPPETQEGLEEKGTEPSESIIDERSTDAQESFEERSTGSQENSNQ